MNLKKWLCLVMAILMALSAAAMAEGDVDLAAQLEAAQARVAELEAEVELYRPYYESQIVAEFGEDGIVWREDAQAQFDEASQMYAQYGIPVDTYADQIKQSIVESLVREGVLKAKADELGLSELDDETLASLTAEAAADFETYVGYYGSYFAQEGASEEENREATIKGLNDAGISEEVILESRISSFIDEKLHDAVTADVSVTEDEVKAAYDRMVAEDQENYGENANDFADARNEDALIAWNPEGFRTVKHVLVKFNDDQASQYSDLQSALKSLQDELAALDEAEAAVEAAEDADATAEEAEQAAEEVAGEEAEVPRSREEIQTDIGSVGTAIEALYSELLPRAQEVIDAFNDGADIDALIAEYGEDPGMTVEPTASQGYVVGADVTSYDPAFTEGAMSIAGVGQISEPVYGSYGIHIIYYLADVTPGPVPYEDIHDKVEHEALEDKVDESYNSQVDAWIEAANVVYHLDRF